MRRTLTLAAIGLCLGLPGAAFAQQDAPAKEQSATKKADIYDESADARQQIADALASAKKENRRVLIQWGAN